MKIRIRKFFDGRYNVGFCDNLPSCYVQSLNETDVAIRLRRAIEIYRKNCELNDQTIPVEADNPILDKKIRFETISTDQLLKIFQRMNYHVEYRNHESVLLSNSNFPFNRVHVPNTDDISPLIISKLFGKHNTYWIGLQTKIYSTG